MKSIIISLLLIALFSISAYSQKTLRADYAKKIRTATPKPLPQSPISEKLKSDAEDENLKGRVKSIVEENVALSGIAKPYGRTITNISDFDEKGNFLRQVYFEYRGRPTDVTVYGYIDGARVSTSNQITYGDELVIALTGDEFREKLEERETKEKAKPDLRYEYKYEYKYADGKLTEMQMIKNTGIKGMRYVYNHSKNQVEELVFTDIGELNQKFLITFDEKGNEIERIYYNIREPKEYDDSKYSFKYELFDKQGNWIKRVYSEAEIKNGKKVQKPIAIEYRTIAYYP